MSRPKGFRASSTASLEDLFGRMAVADHDAFEELYTRMAGPVYGLVRHILLDPPQSEEVVQDVFLEAWRQAPRFDPELGSARGWLLRIAHRRAVDRVRATRAAREREDRFIQPSPDYDNVVEHVETRLEGEQVRRCLDNLTDLQRETIMLAYYGSNTYPQVARLLQIPLGTVKTRMRDALTRLRTCLGLP